MTEKKSDKKAIEDLTQDVKGDALLAIPVPEDSEAVSRKKVIYAEIDDEVTNIYDKIRPLNYTHIYIVVPKRAILFQSVVNLKILKRKAHDDEKVIYLVTNDKNGINLAQQVGIEVYNQENNEGKPTLFSADTGDEKMRITPLRATVNSVDEQTPTRLKERKISISEILNINKRKAALDISKIKTTINPASKKNEKPKFVIVAPNRQALISLVVVSMVILLVIVYIALPGATLYITPTASVLEKSVNITLADYSKNKAELDTRPPHMIASFPIEKTITASITHFATGKKFSDRASNASGKITIFNTTDTAWPLVPETRFQTDEGIVFRIKSAVTVPAVGADGPGKVEAYATADQNDANGSIVGERGNIEPSRFFLPGLKESSRAKVYAENYEPMKGGVTDYISFISAEDIEAARGRMNDTLLKDIPIHLQKEVDAKARLEGSGKSYLLLRGDQALKVGDVKINVPTGLENKEIKEFKVTGEVTANGVYYEREAMLEILRAELSLKKSPQKELIRINEDSSSHRIFEWDTNRGKIKLTANIKGIEQYAIDPDKEGGARLIVKIKDHIAGKDIEAAKVFVQNLPEVNKVEIDSWPAWSPTIPTLTENIKFEIRDAIEAQ